MANLTLNYTNLMDDIGFLVGWGASSGFTSSQTAKAETVLNAGYSTFLNAPYAPGKCHRWSFLEPKAQLTTTAPYSTGTVGISAGVVTLSVAGTFPSWAAQGQLSVSGSTYPVDTRDGDNQVTLEDTSVNVTSGTTYSLERIEYDLPTDFGGFGSGPIINTSESETTLKCIERVSEAAIRQLWDSTAYTSYPRYAAHYVKAVSDNNSLTYQQHVVEFWPPADQAYVLEYTYIVNPSELDDTTNTIPLGGPRFRDVIRAAVLSEAEQTIMDTMGIWTSRFQSMLANAVTYDRQMSSPRSYGKMKDTSDFTNIDWSSYDRPIPPGDIYTYTP